MGNVPNCFVAKVNSGGTENTTLGHGPLQIALDYFPLLMAQSSVMHMIARIRNTQCHTDDDMTEGFW